MTDDETNISYDVELTLDEVKRCETDLLYATQLLERAKINKEFAIAATVADKSISNVRDNENEEANIWTKSATMIFIELYQKYYKDVESGKCTQKNIFEKISKDMQHMGYGYTAKQCSTKLSSLKRKYKKIKDHNQKSGNDMQTWEYYNALDEIFRKKSWIEPLSTASSCDIPSSSNTMSISNSTSSSSANANSVMSNVSGCNKRRKMEDHWKDMKDERKKQHADKMQRLDATNKLLEKLINTIDKNT